MAKDYKNIGNVYQDLGSCYRALEYHKKALEINTEIIDKSEMAKDLYNISFPLYSMGKKEEALKHLFTAKAVLLDFEKETGYSHPFLKNVEDRISYLERDKK